MIGVACLPEAISLDGRLVDLLVQRIVEVVRLEEARHAVVRLVVDEDGAEQRLLGLDVVGRGAEGQGVGARRRCRRVGGLAAGDCVHAPALGQFPVASHSTDALPRRRVYQFSTTRSTVAELQGMPRVDAQLHDNASREAPLPRAEGASRRDVGRGRG